MAVRVVCVVVSTLLAVCELAGGTGGSGDGFRPTVPAVDEDQCAVPAYANTPLNASADDERNVILEAQCYLACIERAGLEDINDIVELNSSTDTVWPYYNFISSRCGPYQELQECTRGCIVWATDMDINSVNQCKRRCKAHCDSECDEDDCYYPFNSVCAIGCSNNLCGPGCSQYSETVQHICSHRNGSCQGVPAAPSAPPDIQQPPSNVIAGVYTVNLTQPMPSETPRNESGGVVFLYKVQESSTGLLSYVLVKDPTQTISLSDFACQDVLLSFAVIDLSGASLFSPTINLTVYGDPTRIPNPVQDLIVTQRADVRYGFFGHAVIDITWRKPDNMKYLQGYNLQVTSTDTDNNRCGDAEYRLDDISINDTSLTVMAMAHGQILVMTCFYTVKVYSIGDDSDNVLTEDIVINEVTPEVTLECSRLWDSERYFTIVMHWVLPEYVTAEGVINRFGFEAQLISKEREATSVVDFLRVTNSRSPVVNKTVYTENLVTVNPLAPQANELYDYRAIMYVAWSPSNIHVPSVVTTSCDVDATSPAPSLVENLSLDSHIFLGDTQIQLDLTWSPPNATNGDIAGYDVCISPHPLNATADPSSLTNTQCEILVPELTSTTWTPFFIAAGSNCLYFQMRAQNTFVAGNWSTPYIIPIDTEDAVQLDCVSQWNDGALDIISSWSVKEVSCNGVNQTVEKAIVKLLLVTSSEMRQLNISEFSNDDLYIKEFTNLPQQAESSTTYKVLLEVDWIDRLTLLPEVSTQSCTVKASIPKTVNAGVWVAIGVCLLAAALVALTCCLVLMQCAVNIRRKKQLRRIAADACDDDPMYIMGAKRSMAASNILAPPQTDDWEIPPTHVLMDDCLGEGAFGEVYKGVIKGPIINSRVRHTITRNAICTQVAIKLLKKSAKGSERNDFLQEIEMMKKVTEGQNPHVVSMMGCVTVQEPLCLITEFVKYGDLLSYLKANMRLYTGNGLDEYNNPYVELGNVSAADLISFAYQIASGMEYLSSLGIVHRDLASRNILVDEGKVLKITDFGMSRKTEDVYVQQSKGRVPLKWMAIESIVAREFTTASDVWAYGITLWEIGTLGGFPYPNIPNEELLSQLKRGYRMEKPDNCSPEVYEIMLNCWNEDPKKRPCFSLLRSKFDSMLLEERRDDYIILQIDADKNYYKMEPNEAFERNGHIQISPQVNRRSRVSMHVAETSFAEDEKPQSHLPSSPLASPLLLHSPQAKRHSHFTCSPNHDAALEKAPLSPARPLSALYTRSEQPPQKQPVMNQYVDEPFKLAVPPVNGHAGGQHRSGRGISEASSESGRQERDATTPDIQITVTPGND